MTPPMNPPTGPSDETLLSAAFTAHPSGALPNETLPPATAPSPIAGAPMPPGELLDFDLIALTRSTTAQFIGKIAVGITLGLVMGGAMVGALLLIIPLTRPLGRMATSITIIGIMLVIAALIITIINLVMRRGRTRFQEVAAKIDFTNPAEGLNILLPQMFASPMLGRRAYIRSTLDLPKLLAKRGLTNITLRICQAKNFYRITPIPDVIEPQPLNESNPAFDDLRTAAVSDAPPPPATKPQRGGLFRGVGRFFRGVGAALLPRPQSRSDASARQGRRRAMNPFVRNLTLNGGAFLILIFAAQAIGPLFESIRIGRPTPMLYFWIALIGASIFLPLHTLKRFRKHWLVANGGIVLRYSRMRDKDWKLYVFNRRSAVLSVRELHKTGQWWVGVSDAERTESTVMTAAEAQVLIAAWLSPLPPPPVERLTDLLD